MTSESQERMLAIVTPDEPRRGARPVPRGGRSAPSVIGRVTDTARFRVYDGLFDAVGVPGENPPAPRGDAPPDGVVRRAAGGRRAGREPRRRPGVRPARARAPADRAARAGRRSRAGARAARSPSAPTSSDELLALLATPTIADKSWVYRQYDHQLFLNTVVGPGGDAAVLRLKGTARGARAHHRRQGALLRARPARRRSPRRDRGGAQPRVRRRGAARRSSTASTSATPSTPR